VSSSFWQQSRTTTDNTFLWAKQRGHLCMHSLSQSTTQKQIQIMYYLLYFMNNICFYSCMPHYDRHTSTRNNLGCYKILQQAHNKRSSTCMLYEIINNEIMKAPNDCRDVAFRTFSPFLKELVYMYIYTQVIRRLVRAMTQNKDKQILFVHSK
jgi:hypothetical protein